MDWTDGRRNDRGAEGEGTARSFHLTDAKVQDNFKDEAATKAIKEGLKSPEDKTLMKPFDTLSDDEIKALVAYVRGLKK